AREGVTEIPGGPPARHDALENLRRPGGALAALSALRAALVSEEPRGASDLLHEILRVVENDDAARAEHRAVRHEPLVVHEARLGFIDGLNRHRDATGDDRLEFASRERAATELV